MGRCPIFALIFLAASCRHGFAYPPRFDHASINITGPPAIVWQGGASNGSCGFHDIPDGPARAWRTADGQVTLVASWATARAARGPSLLGVKKECDVLFNSTFSGTNSLYEDHEWLIAPWILPNQTVVGYMHQEYHGWEHGNCSVPKQDVTADCWMVAMTSTVSVDGGRTFAHTFPPPHHLVAPAPFPYSPDHSGFGYGDPSGIVRSPLDGHYYMAVHQRRPYRGMLHGTCMLRTADVGDVHSWRGWNGSAFSVELRDPYGASFDPASALEHACTPLPSLPTFTMLSLKWSTYFGAFLGVGQGPLSGRKGAWYQFSLSDDLVDWSDPLPIRPMQDSSTVPPAVQNYVSILDPESTDPNFNTVGETAMMYFSLATHEKPECPAPGCQDLMREPVMFSKG